MEIYLCGITMTNNTQKHMHYFANMEWSGAKYLVFKWDVDVIPWFNYAMQRLQRQQNVFISITIR
jgi:hypothetical protein